MAELRNFNVRFGVIATLACAVFQSGFLASRFLSNRPRHEVPERACFAVLRFAVLATRSLAVSFHNLSSRTGCGGLFRPIRQIVSESGYFVILISITALRTLMFGISAGCARSGNNRFGVIVLTFFFYRTRNKPYARNNHCRR